MAELTLLEYFSEHKWEIRIFLSNQDMKILHVFRNASASWLEIPVQPSKALDNSGFISYNAKSEKYKLSSKGRSFLSALGLLREDSKKSNALHAIRKGIATQREWKIIWDQYSPIVYNVGRRFGLNKTECEDIVQEVFIRVFRNVQKIEKVDNFDSWFWTISYNEMRRYIRKPKRTVSLESLGADAEKPLPTAGDVSGSVSPVKALEYKLLLEEVKKCVEQMPPRMKLTMLLVRFEDLPYKEAAKIMHVTEKAVQQQLGLGKKYLRKCLKEKT